MQKLLAQARGDQEADLVFKNGLILDVFNGALLDGSLAVSQGYVLGFGDYKAREEVDLAGRILSPAFIDGHCHLESSMVTIGEFARTVIPLGTTTVFLDPHELANVAGQEGLEYFLSNGPNYPWNFKLLIPSCVPASDFETAGHVLKAEDLQAYLKRDHVFGLGEVMNYPGVIQGDEEVHRKIAAFASKFIDGHAPGLGGKELNAYCLAGIRADHEVVSPAEAREKIRAGMYIMIREASAARNLAQLLEAVDDHNFSRFLWATDDRHPADLVKEGHINFLIKKAISLGMDPIRALLLATINAAQALGLKKIGALAPGYQADMVIIDNLKDLQVEAVYKDGQLVAQGGQPCFAARENLEANANLMKTMNVGAFSASSFDLPRGEYYRLIELIPGEIYTREKIERLASKEDLPKKNICKLAVLERHHGTGNVALGLLQGLGLKEGALASSVAHDSHHLIVAGSKKEDMLLAVEKIIEMQGGLVVVKEGKVLASLSLPLAGLMSTKSLKEVAQKEEELNAAALSLGVQIQNPFMVLSFLSLPVIPALKLTDRGLFDSLNFKYLPLVVS